MSEALDAVVVGGGAVGVCTALELARRGASVTLLERGASVAWGCSAGNAGLICPSHSEPLNTPAALRAGLSFLTKPDSPLYLRPRRQLLPWIARYLAACTPARSRAAARVIRELSERSLVLHEELATAGLETTFERRGLLNVFSTEAGFAAGRKEAAEQPAASPQVLDREGLRELVPAVGGDPVGAVYYPEEAHCDPLRFVQAVAGAAAEAGVRLRTGVEVLALRRRNGRIESVQTTAGELTAGTVVLAAGAWTPVLTRPLGIYLPVEGGKGYHVDFERGPADPSLPVAFAESWVVATPMGGRIRLAGTLELAGLDERVSPLRVDAIVRAGRRGLPGLEGRSPIEVWRGLRPCTPDGLPAIGRQDGLDNLVLATGHAMMGLTLAPITGRLVAELVGGEEPSYDLAPVRPGRFQPLLGRD
ncbi:MAG: FAD-dependent oxidoreductase [Gaiellales bacterium]